MACSTSSSQVLHLDLSFSLRDQPNNDSRNPNRSEISELQKAFPTIRSVAFVYPYLQIIVLPLQPWPLYAADLPLRFFTDHNDLPHEIGGVARDFMKSTIENELLEYETPGPDTIMEIFELVNGKGAGVERIEWNGLCLRALGRGEGPAQGWISILPRGIDGFLISYFWNVPFEAQDSAEKPFSAGRGRGKQLFGDCPIQLLGNGNAVCFDGCYGGFIWNDKREILGRFSFQEKDGQKLVFAPMIKKSIEQDYFLNSVVAGLSRL
ncbi:uncharacterized protein RSE6_09467 [Rhynchosporium secalis]|uniref:Uncharacterized protein n=1 Tax=Rhynchosporium secalis TaxID=38038 RepID=A0A1E1MJ49_RHYSE|nr:uncharacterized protein RSE6_09467 [Rhynchosporium secalis]